MVAVARESPVDKLTLEIVAFGILTNALATPERTGKEIPDCKQLREKGSASQIKILECVFVKNILDKLLNKNVRVIIQCVSTQGAPYWDVAKR